MKRSMFLVVVGAFVMYVAAALVWPAPSSRGFDLAAFGRLPVLMQGRVQPIDSVARLGLLQVHGSVSVPLEGAAWWRIWKPRRTLGATEWLVEVLVTPDLADTRKVFPIRDPKLLDAIGMKVAVGGTASYSYKDLEPRLEEIGKQVRRISRIKTGRAEWERECLGLRNALVIYHRLKNSLQPNSLLQREAGGKPIPGDVAARMEQYQTDLRAGVAAAVGREHGKSDQLDEAVQARMRAFARPYVSVSRAAYLSVIPPTDLSQGRDRWENIGTTLVNSARTGLLPAPVGYFAGMSSAFAAGKPADFNRDLEKYRRWLAAKGLGPEVARARSEAFFNAFGPFIRATAVYLAALALCGTLWFRSRQRDARYLIASGLVALAFVLDTTGLLFEMMLDGHLPLANVYSSILFTGWGLTGLCLVVEWFSRKGIALTLAAMAGVVSEFAAHNIAPGGALELARAALDSGFWLTAVGAAAAMWWVGRGESGARLPAAARDRSYPKRQNIAAAKL